MKPWQTKRHGKILETWLRQTTSSSSCKSKQSKENEKAGAWDAAGFFYNQTL